MRQDQKANFFILELKNKKELDFNEIFGNNYPIQIEIGSGNGHFLKDKSLICPNINFLGFEIKQKRIDKILRKLNQRDNENVKICRFFIDEDINKVIKKNTVSEVYINFPDPWPKKRHFKRRLIQNDFIDSINKILRVEGKINFVTDHVGYRDWIIDKFTFRSDFINEYSSNFSLQPYEGYCSTLFEEKQLEKGFPPYFMCFRKIK